MRFPQQESEIAFERSPSVLQRIRMTSGKERLGFVAPPPAPMNGALSCFPEFAIHLTLTSAKDDAGAGQTQGGAGSLAGGSACAAGERR